MIRVNNITKIFETSKINFKEFPSFYSKSKFESVKDLSFECVPGKVFALLGANGAGKTTTLRMISTMLKPTAGSISVCGHDTVKEGRQVRQKIGFLTGSTALYDRLTPNETIKYFADLNGVDAKVREERKDKYFTLLDVHRYANQRVGKLSTGMKQKVSIIRTIIHDPEVIVFDEPTSGLDVISSQHIIELIQQAKADGKTIILSTHRMEEVNLLGDDLALIHRGKLLFKGTLQEFKGQMQTDSLDKEFIRIVNQHQS